MLNIQNQLVKLFENHFGSVPDEIGQLPPSGSNRRYFRLRSGDSSAIAAYNPDRAENEAFMYIVRKLAQAGVNVPLVYASDLDNHVYLQEDLGDTNLFDLIESHREDTQYLTKLYRSVIDQMPAIQVKAANDFDFTRCFPRQAFDSQSIHWDLNYFKYHFLKLANTPFHEQKLEDDFIRLSGFLLEAPSDFFLFRDFQSRNVMLKDGNPYFIDFQGGRRGALQYDLASLLYEAKANLPENLRRELLNYYLQVFSEFDFFDREEFQKYYPSFALIRQLQAFGAYGYRGYFEKKAFFLRSIPFGLKNLQEILVQVRETVDLPHLQEVLSGMITHFEEEIPETHKGKLTLAVNSFSYRKSMPDDYTGNGGGFVFDCRGLPNPGRYPEFKTKTGRDAEVSDYLGQHGEVEQFLQQVFRLTEISIRNYIQREFEHLMISFGCTGGQHRSVFCAERYAEWAKQEFDVEVVLRHREIG